MRQLNKDLFKGNKGLSLLGTIVSAALILFLIGAVGIFWRNSISTKSNLKVRGDILNTKKALVNSLSCDKTIAKLTTDCQGEFVEIWGAKKRLIKSYRSDSSATSLKDFSLRSRCERDGSDYNISVEYKVKEKKSAIRTETKWTNLFGGLPLVCNLPNIEALCATGPTKTLSTSVNFPSRSGCSFGKNGNLSAKSSYFRARETQSRSVAINGYVCSMDLESSSSSFEYDDDFFMTLGGYVIISGQAEYVGYLNTDPVYSDLRIWDFAEVRGKNRTGSDAKYCLNGSSCQVAITDSIKEPLSIKLSTKSISSLAARIHDKDSLDFEVIISGDNNSDDCEHSGLDLNVEVVYVEK